MIAIVSAVLLFSMMLPLYKHTANAGKNQVQQNHAIVHALSEQLNVLKMIKTGGFEEQFIQEIKEISVSLEHRNQYFIHILAISKLAYAIGLVIIFSILLYFALTVITISLPSLMMLLIVFLRILPRVSTMQQTYQRLIHQIPSYTEVKQLLQSCMANREMGYHNHSNTLTFNESITFHNVHFSYQQNHISPIIKQLSFCIKKNTTIAIMGPSGAGKSTLADLMVGLINPTSGRIYIDRTPLDEKNKLVWRKSVAYVAQEHLLLNKSIRQNLQLFTSEKPDVDLWEALRSASAAGFVEALEHGLDTIIGEQGIRLSGGEHQRLSLARALLAKPQLLILDECTSSLDKNNINEIQKALKQLHGTMTIIIISHQMDMCDLAYQKIILGSASQSGLLIKKEPFSPKDRSIPA
jgi:ATP-binding cassette subfamily C protein